MHSGWVYMQQPIQIVNQIFQERNFENMVKSTCICYYWCLFIPFKIKKKILAIKNSFTWNILMTNSLYSKNIHIKWYNKCYNEFAFFNMMLLIIQILNIYTDCFYRIYNKYTCNLFKLGIEMTERKQIDKIIWNIFL